MNLCAKSNLIVCLIHCVCLILPKTDAMATTFINNSHFPIADALWTLIQSQPSNVQDVIERKFLDRRKKSVAAKMVSTSRESGAETHHDFLEFLKSIPLNGANVPADEDGKFVIIDEKYKL